MHEDGRRQVARAAVHRFCNYDAFRWLREQSASYDRFSKHFIICHDECNAAIIHNYAILVNDEVVPLSKHNPVERSIDTCYECCAMHVFVMRYIPTHRMTSKIVA